MTENECHKAKNVMKNYLRKTAMYRWLCFKETQRWSCWIDIEMDETDETWYEKVSLSFFTLSAALKEFILFSSLFLIWVSSIQLPFVKASWNYGALTQTNIIKSDEEIRQRFGELSHVFLGKNFSRLWKGPFNGQTEAFCDPLALTFWNEKGERFLSMNTSTEVNVPQEMCCNIHTQDPF